MREGLFLMPEARRQGAEFSGRRHERTRKGGGDDVQAHRRELWPDSHVLS